MKHFATLVTEPAGESRTDAVIALISLTDGDLTQLKQIRQMVQNIGTTARSVQRSLAYVAFYAVDVNWLLVKDEDEDKLYQATYSSDEGYVEIPQDVHDQRRRVAQEDIDENTVRTENDFVRFTDKGLYYFCEEKHCYAILETHFIPWHVLFDEPAPPETVLPQLR